MDQQQQWAATLKKNQRNAVQNQKVPLTAQRGQIEEALSFYKNELQKAIASREREKAVHALKQLIGLRGRLVTILLNETKKRSGKIGRGDIKRQIGNYFIDCKRLLRAASNALAKTHGRP